MTVADVLDRLTPEDRPLVIAAMNAVAAVAVEKALEAYAPAMIRAGVKLGAEAVGHAIGSNVTVDDGSA